MEFWEAVRSVFSKYAQFSGRARRSEYWWYSLFTVLVSLALGAVDGAIFGFEESDPSPISGLYGLATFIPGLSVSVRRLHDTNRSAWWLAAPIFALVALFALLPVARFSGATDLETSSQILTVAIFAIILTCLVILLAWFVTDGTHGPNRYGPDPKAPLQDADIFS